MTEPSHAPRMVSPKHFSGTLCGTRGPITMNRPTCAACVAEQEKGKTDG